MADEIAFAFDPDGRRVYLDDERWRHVVLRHDLADHLDDIMRSIAHPTRIVPDGDDPTGRHYVTEDWTGAERSLRVVVASGGRIITAWPE